ncbi:hypothetical protein F5144DRAFT_651071 [Chaetomium tenue]|uniref:Uncharacterized protein n=1 Tax=Chaetomium tenue TaxID=1854479 RepID=A0ACB7PB63_9PEZI|nr:hypothetical protein F5144DRAFT_651071 [Chaetomium globosum]
MNTAGAVVLAIVLLLLAAGVGWVIFTRVRASQLGLPPPPLKSYIPFLNRSPTPYTGPSPRSGGIMGWFSRAGGGGRNARTAAGAYEGPSPSGSGSYNAGYGHAGGSGGGGGGGRGFEEDDPWDSRVGGYNPYEEERELGLVPPGGGGGGSGGGEGYAMNLAVAPGGMPAAGGGGGGGEEERRGRPRSRSPGPGTSAAAAAPARDPFGDGAEPSNLSLRGVSPRPMDDGASFAARKAAKREEDRRSMFREEV